MSVLEVRNLSIEFAQHRGKKFRAVDNVSFSLEAGRTLALVGESGSGKSTIARTLSRLMSPTSGELFLHGEKVGRRGSATRTYRRSVQMVFQDPFASLNPAFSVDHHLRRPLAIHGQKKAGMTDAIHNLLRSVNLTPAEVIANKFPHELSGGQRQRVAIARALAPQPEVILADEPVSMLDVSVRLEILNLLESIKRDRNLAILYITHDLATARHFSDEILVMFRGEIVERGRTDDVILAPAHPYTKLLANSVPSRSTKGKVVAATTAREMGNEVIADDAERSESFATTGCPFRYRCPSAMDICRDLPEEVSVGDSHRVRCWLHIPAHREK